MVANSLDICLKNVFSFPVFSKDTFTAFTVFDSQPFGAGIPLLLASVLLLGRLMAVNCSS